LDRHLQGQVRAEGNTGLADQRGAVDVGGACRIGAGEAATHLAAAENQIQPGCLGVLQDDHLAAPLAPAERVRARVIEEAVAAHDAAALEHHDAGRVAAPHAAHFNCDAVEPVANATFCIDYTVQALHHGSVPCL